MFAVFKVPYLHCSLYFLSLETGWRFSGDRGCRTQDGTALLSVLWSCDSKRRPAGRMCAAADCSEKSSGWTTVGTDRMDQINGPVLIWRDATRRAQRYCRIADGHGYANKLPFSPFMVRIMCFVCKNVRVLTQNMFYSHFFRCQNILLTFCLLLWKK